MEEHASEIECLILGNSHSAWGVDPASFSMNTFNLAFAGQPLIFDELLLEKYIDMMPSLQYVILSVSYSVPYRDFEHEKNDNHTRIYPIYFGIKPDYDTWKYHFEVTAISPRVNFSRLLKLLSTTELRCSEFGFYTASCMSDTMQISNAASQLQNEYYNRVRDSLSIIYDKNIVALHNIATICENNGVNLFLVVPPHTVTYLNNLNPIMKKETISLLQNISHSTNVHFLNFSGDTRFLDNTIFSDEDHLCRDGAEKYSKILNDTIKCLYMLSE